MLQNQGGGGYFSPSSCTQRITFYHYRLYFLKGLLASYLDNNNIIINTAFNWNIVAIKGTLFLYMRKSLFKQGMMCEETICSFGGEWCVKEQFAYLAKMFTLFSWEAILNISGRVANKYWRSSCAGCIWEIDWQLQLGYIYSTTMQSISFAVILILIEGWWCWWCLKC